MAEPQTEKQTVVTRHLPTLASWAAIQLDNLIIGRPFDENAVIQLLDVLGGSPLEPEGSVHECDAPSVAVVVRRATAPVTEAAKGDVLDYARRQLARVVSDHANVSRDDITSLRDLCVAISRRASRYTVDDDEDAVF